MLQGFFVPQELSLTTCESCIKLLLKLGKTPKKQSAMGKKILLDNAGRRSGGDRRAFSYGVYIPERRSGQDRRDGLDRRSKPRE